MKKMVLNQSMNIILKGTTHLNKMKNYMHIQKLRYNNSQGTGQSAIRWRIVIYPNKLKIETAKTSKQ